MTSIRRNRECKDISRPSGRIGFQFISLIIFLQSLSFGSADSDICVGKPFGAAIEDLTDCTGYFECIFNEPQQRNCPTGQRFDIITESCVIGKCPPCKCETGTSTPSQPPITEQSTESSEPSTSSAEPTSSEPTILTESSSTSTSTEIPSTTSSSSEPSTSLSTEPSSTSSLEPTSSEPTVSTEISSESTEIPSTTSTSAEPASSEPSTSLSTQPSNNTELSTSPESSTSSLEPTSSEPTTSSDSSSTSSEIPSSSNTSASPETECSTKPNCQLLAPGSFHRDKKDCRKYYVCSNGIPVGLSCPLGQYFDDVAKVCNFESMVECSPSVDENCTQTPAETTLSTTKPSCQSEPNCEVEPNGSVHRDPKDCGKFYFCKDGVAVGRACRKGEYFDLKINTCLFSSLVDCTPNENCVPTKSTSPATPSKTSTPISRPTSTMMVPNGQVDPNITDCMDLLNGAFFRHPVHCNVFYVCRNRMAVKYSCPYHQWFDNIRMLCNFKNLVNCPSGKD